MKCDSPCNLSFRSALSKVATRRFSNARLATRILLYMFVHAYVLLVQPRFEGFRLPSLTVLIPRPAWVNTASSEREASICSSKPPIPSPVYTLFTNASANAGSVHTTTDETSPNGCVFRKSFLQEVMISPEHVIIKMLFMIC